LAYKQNVSSKCPCDSGKKYKNCCKKKDILSKSLIDLGEKIKNGELPFGAEIISENGATSSMKITSAFIDTGYGMKTILEDEIALSTGSSAGDTIDKSSAKITVPVNSHDKPKIYTSGNASVTNETSSYKISIQGNPKKLKIKSESGLFAVLRVAKQRNTGISYLDVLFGTKGTKEQVDQSGSKNRPHIAFHPDGNSKFIRLSNYECELNNMLDYDATSKEIFPSTVEIRSNVHSESIFIEFEFFSSKKEVVLKSAGFKQ